MFVYPDSRPLFVSPLWSIIDFRCFYYAFLHWKTNWFAQCIKDKAIKTTYHLLIVTSLKCISRCDCEWEIMFHGKLNSTDVENILPHVHLQYGGRQFSTKTKFHCTENEHAEECFPHFGGNELSMENCFPLKKDRRWLSIFTSGIRRSHRCVNNIPIRKLFMYHSHLLPWPVLQVWQTYEALGKVN